ncbi:hypothetical protein P4V23_27635, partial [Brevibacillus agri]|nr:hypothetical protein [Brevibacillus agri]
MNKKMMIIAFLVLILIAVPVIYVQALALHKKWFVICRSILNDIFNFETKNDNNQTKGSHYPFGN